MGARGKGIVIARNTDKIQKYPITGSQSIDQWEFRNTSEFKKNNSMVNMLSEGGKNEYAVLADDKGIPYMAYKGERHSVPLDKSAIQSSGTLTHYHPNPGLGGTLSMQDLKVFAQSNLKGIRAFAQQGQLYSLTAGPNADRKGLLNWVKKNQKLQYDNFAKSYDSAYKNATTTFKDKKGNEYIKIRVRQIVDTPQGPKQVTKVVKRAPMTKKQAAAYARQYSVGQYDRMYKKALDKFGFNYVSTKAGRNIK